MAPWKFVFNSLLIMGRKPTIVSIRKSHKFSSFEISSLKELAIDVLNDGDVWSKASKTNTYATAWLNGQVPAVLNSHSETLTCPNTFIRNPVEVSSLNAKQKKSVVMLAIHGIANAESYAIDLFWDLIARYSHYNLPKEFYDEMVFIANQESEHFLSWAHRLEELGCPFGSLPTNDVLCKNAMETSECLKARLAIINLTHEAKGLDTYLQTREKFKNCKDEASVEILDKNAYEEIGHVRAGVKWFRYLCERENVNELEEFHRLVKKYYRGKLYGPFNVAARAEAGMTEDWYVPLTLLPKYPSDKEKKEIVHLS